MKTRKWNELETALLKWFSNAQESGVVTSEPILMEKGNDLASKLEETGWLT